MNQPYETRCKISRCQYELGCDRIAAPCRDPLGSVSRFDVPSPHTTVFRSVDSTLPIDPYDVDAIDDRRLFFVSRQCRDRCSQRGSAVADRVGTQRNQKRIGNTIGTDHVFGRHQAFGPVQRSQLETRSSLCRRWGARPNQKPRQRQGQALLEMAFLIPLLVIIIGATISFGLFFFQTNVMQQAVDVGAMEIARFPFTPDAQMGLGDLNVDPNDTSLLMNDERFKDEIYDEERLVLDPGFDVNDLPLLNRLLVPLMVLDFIDGEQVRRYPGAVVTNGNGNRTILIPVMAYDRNTGTESLIQWVAPVEEIQTGDGDRPYSLSATSASTSFAPGMVALRVNFPVQSTTLVNRTGEQGELIIDADDASISDGDTGTNYSLVIPNESGPADTTIHSGRYGLGRQAALLRTAGVRPFRRVLSTQSIYRREVFQ